MQTIFTRQAQLGACAGYTIPFDFAERPTLYLEAGGVTLPMLFDTGTFLPIFVADGRYLNPGINWLEDSAAAAGLDGKPEWQAYGYLELARLGAIRIRNLPFRLFSGSGQGDADFAGAFAPILFQQYVIRVSNSHQVIELIDRADWVPGNTAAVLPLLTIPRGTFVSLQISGNDVWLHLDTGFSGGIGILPEFRDAHPAGFAGGEGESTVFLGWNGPVVCLPLTVNELVLPRYGNYGWTSSEPLRFADLPALKFPGNYAEVTEIEVAGIMGSGFLARFDYAIDYMGNRLYLIEVL